MGLPAFCGTTPKTVKRVIARHEFGRGAPRGARGGISTTRSPAWWPSEWRSGRAGSRRSVCCLRLRRSGMGGGAELSTAGRGAESVVG
jgi:hypothetical protein